MSAHEIPVRTLGLAFAVTGLLAWACCGRRRGAPAIGAGLLAVQTALHASFSAGQGHAAAPGSHTGMDRGVGMDMGAGIPASAMDLSAAAVPDPLGMTAAHLLAALVCGLWLARGEAALFALARTAGAAAFAPLRRLLAVVRVRVPEPPRPVRPRPRTRRLHGVVLSHALSRRGPPRLSAPRATALGAHV
ncbi:hypothetical protein ACGFMM_29360 [Streptomyces sp. NPDC048604]|uniref:hypothetical protein n=1 Tax=Streptomyces sp. NPDC048604 TaxID=3365578 RepID=UPI0037189BAB